MNNVDFTKIKAVAFDIDGTLYRAIDLSIRITPLFFAHNQFFLKYGLVRKILRKNSVCSDFTKEQARLMALKLHCTTEKAQEKLDKIVYKGFSKYFHSISPCRGSIELIHKLKNNGYKIGLLSDFPPEQKGDIWGIKEICDVCIGTEEIGALKPSSIPFIKLAELLQISPEEVLYVGNSHKYDVIGANQAGMKTAWIITPLQKIYKKKSKIADITFVHYNELENIIFNNSTVKKT